MMADVNVNESAPSGEREEEKCGLDTTGYQDLPKAADADCNAISDGNGKDDADGSYVFLSGTEAAADDPVEKTDPNSKSELLENVGSLAKEPDNEVEGPEVDQSAIQGDDTSLPYNAVTLDDEPNVVKSESDPHQLDDLGKVDHARVDSTVDIELTGEVPQAVEHESQLFNPGNAKSTESTVQVGETQELQVTSTNESPVTVSESAECESELLHTSSTDAEEGGEEDDSTMQVIETQEPQVTSTNAAAYESNHSSNNEGDSKSEFNTDTEENQGSHIEVTEGVQNDLDLYHNRKPTELNNNLPVEDYQKASEDVLEQNLEAAPCLVVAEVKMEEAESVDVTASNESVDVLPAGLAQDSAAQTIVDDLVDANQSRSEQNSEQVETLISFDAENGQGFPAANEDDTVGDPPNDIPSEEEGVNGYASYEKSEGMPSSQAQESVSQATLVGDFVNASETTNELNRPSEIAKSLPTPVGSCGSLVVPVSDTTVEPVVGVVTQPADNKIIQDARKEIDVEKIYPNSSESVDYHAAADTKVEIEGENGPLATNAGPSFLADDVKSEIDTDTGSASADAEEGLSMFSNGNSDSKNITECSNSASFDNPDVHDSIENKTSLPVDVKAEPQVENISMKPSRDDDGIVVESKVPNGFVETSDISVNCIQDEAHRENTTDPVAGIDGDENTSIGGVCKDETSTNGGEKTCQEVVGNDRVCEDETSTNDYEKTCLEVVGNDRVCKDETSTNSDQKTCQEVVGDVGVCKDENSTNADEITCQQLVDVDGARKDETSTSSESSIVDANDGSNVAAELGRKPFYYMIRVPRHDDENLKEQIKHAQFQVDEKTKDRDAIRAEIQMKRANCKECGEQFDEAVSEEKAARDLLKAKRKEMDSVQSVINRVKSVMSVDDIDGRIRNMEHVMQHETLPLKEEKQFIREIKQMKQLREQLSSNMGSEDEVQQAMDQKDQVEERLKFLRKEADILKDKVVKAEAATKVAKKKYHNENDKLNELLARFRAADDIRQEAYSHLQGLRKQSYDKNKYFWRYKDDAKLANDLALKADNEELQRLCLNQVERVMELWNNNDEFRKEYMRCNIRSTVRRLRSLDGRSLGPDEEPPVIPNVANARVAKVNIVPSISTLEGEKAIVSPESEKVEDKYTAKVPDQKNQPAKAKKPVKPVPSGNGLATASGRDELEEARKEEHKRTKEEEEFARKAEELRKKEEADLLKEKRRAEEIIKAREAMERKKRNAEKAQARAALKAQKEAEQREKEREKRARKKEKKKAVADDTNSVNEGEPVPSSEGPAKAKESETREKPMTLSKRPLKPSQFTKQTKLKSIPPPPPPLRNRGKKRMQTWMWVIVTALIVFSLFLSGNSGFSFNFGLHRFGLVSKYIFNY